MFNERRISSRIFPYYRKYITFLNRKKYIAYKED